MKRVLFDAATRHQILLPSCHPDQMAGYQGHAAPAGGRRARFSGLHVVQRCRRAVTRLGRAQAGKRP